MIQLLALIATKRRVLFMILGREQHHNFDAGRTQLVSTRAVAGVLGMVGWVEPSWQAWDTVVFLASLWPAA